MRAPAGSPVNRRTVMAKLGQGMEEIGGVHMVSDVCSYPSPSQAGHFFGVIDGKLTLRRAYDVAKWMEGEAKTTDDPRSFVNRIHNRTEALEAASDGENVLPSVLDAIEEKLGRMERGEVAASFQTPLPAWNRAFGGIMDGCLYALAGRPGCGKTAMMEQIIQGYLEKEIPVSVFEKDMSPQKLIERCVCRAVRVPFWRFNRNQLLDHHAKDIRMGVKVFRDSPLYLYNPKGLTADKMCAIARMDIRTKGVKAIFLDHIQALRVGRDLREGLTAASLTIRANTTDTGIPHFVLAHINRDGGKGGRPKADHIKEFDQLFGDCDAMGLLWSETDRTDFLPGERIPMNLYVAKNRDGALLEEKLLLDGEMLTFHPG